MRITLKTTLHDEWRGMECNSWFLGTKIPFAKLQLYRAYRQLSQTWNSVGRTVGSNELCGAQKCRGLGRQGHGHTMSQLCGLPIDHEEVADLKSPLAQIPDALSSSYPNSG